MANNTYYVYTLARPNGQVFYVGKGLRSRPKEHLSEARVGECVCRKCRIIQKILKSGKDVLITYVFETTDERAAFRREGELIAELSRTFILCNKKQNEYQRRTPKLSPRMTLSEATAHLDQFALPKKEHATKIEEWCDKRIDYLEREWRTARRTGDLEEAEAMMQEIELLRMKVGYVRQHEFIFTFVRKQKDNTSR